MIRRTVRLIVTVGGGMGVAAAVLVYFIEAGTFGPNGSGHAADLPMDWWLVFGFAALGAGLLAALLVDALFGGPKTRSGSRP
jgi:hypothetical protein